MIRPQFSTSIATTCVLDHFDSLTVPIIYEDVRPTRTVSANFKFDGVLSCIILKEKNRTVRLPVFVREFFNIVLIIFSDSLVRFMVLKFPTSKESRRIRLEGRTTKDPKC